MSFISIIKKVGNAALGVEKVVAATGLGNLIPGFGIVDHVLQLIPGGVLAKEIENPLDGQGAIKAAAVKSDFAEGLDFTQQILSLKGEKLTYDEALLQESIDHFTAGYNGLAKLKASFKVVPL